MSVKRQTSQLLTAPAGVGKSYQIIHFIVHEFLPNGKGDVWTNIRLGKVPKNHSTPPAYDGETFADRIGKFVADKYGGDAEAYANRLKMLPSDELRRWMMQERVDNQGNDMAMHGPWEFFKEVDLTGAIIVIDEAHNVCGRKSTRRKKGRWQEFCGELRHRGACIQFVTQAPNKLANEVIHECGKRESLLDGEEERDDVFGIKFFYWLELLAKWRGKYVSFFMRSEYRDRDGKKTRRDSHIKIWRTPEIFALYDSFQAPEKGGVAAGQGIEQREWEKRSWPSLLRWFVTSEENAWRIGRRVGQAGAAAAFIVSIPFLIVFLITSMSSATKTQVAKQEPKLQAKKERRAVGPRITAAPRLPSTSDTKTERLDKPVSILVSSDDEPDEVPAEILSELEAYREAEKWRGTLVMLRPDGATMADGVFYRVGDEILRGPKKGRIIDAVHWKSRSVILDDGTRIFLGDAGLPDVEEGQGSGQDLEGENDTALQTRSATKARRPTS